MICLISILLFYHGFGVFKPPCAFILQKNFLCAENGIVFRQQKTPGLPGVFLLGIDVVLW
jgi:hypothetical protein